VCYFTKKYGNAGDAPTAPRAMCRGNVGAAGRDRMAATSGVGANGRGQADAGRAGDRRRGADPALCARRIRAGEFHNTENDYGGGEWFITKELSNLSYKR